MCLYSRPEQLPIIQEALDNQTFKDFEFLVWDNTKKNDGSKARFWLVKQAKGEAIIFIDDDEIPNPDFVEYMYNEYLKYPKCVLGWFTRIFKGAYQKDAITNSSYGTEVDYVGTGGMIVSKKLFDDNPVLYDIPKEIDKVEDLFLCHIAKQNGYRLIAVKKKLKMIVDGKNQCKDLWAYKENAYKILNNA